MDSIIAKISDWQVRFYYVLAIANAWVPICITSAAAIIAVTKDSDEKKSASGVADFTGAGALLIVSIDFLSRGCEVAVHGQGCYVASYDAREL